MTDDARKLLGGYATGTLTEQERAELFEAALHDQQLFEALADEQALKDLLDDGAARGELLRATEKQPAPWRWMLPVGSLAAAAVITICVLALYRTKQQPVATAQLQRPVEQMRAAAPPIANEAPAAKPSSDAVASTRTAPAPAPALAKRREADAPGNQPVPAAPVPPQLEVKEQRAPQQQVAEQYTKDTNQS